MKSPHMPDRFGTVLCQLIAEHDTTARAHAAERCQGLHGATLFVGMGTVEAHARAGARRVIRHASHTRGVAKAQIAFAIGVAEAARYFAGFEL